MAESARPQDVAEIKRGPLRDGEIRATLRSMLVSKYANDSDTLIIDELGLCQHESRVDFAVVNGELLGYEIKSDSDTLKRLPGQIKIYSRVFDRIVIVCGKSHLAGVRALVPKWWGINIARSINGIVQIRQVRSAKSNPTIDMNAVMQLVWKDEVEAILHEHGLTRLSGKRTHELWALAIEKIDHASLRTIVRRTLKDRGNWRSDSQRKSNGGSRRPVAKSLHCRDHHVLDRIPVCSCLPN
jgi:hypothetical protein